MAKRPIVTDDQHEVLKMLARPADDFHSKTPGVWTPTVGWSWGTNSKTLKLLNALVKKGFVKRGQGLNEFEITVQGRQLVDSLAT